MREALRINPAVSEVHSGLAGALRIKGKLNEAIMEYYEALRLDPNCVLAHFNLAICLQAKGKKIEADEEFATAKRRNPNLRMIQPSLVVKPGSWI